MRKAMWAALGTGVVAGALIAAFTGNQEASAINGEVFRITGSTRLTHFEPGVRVGRRAFVNTVGSAGIAAAIRGNDPKFPTFNLLEHHAGGKAYLRFTSTTQWDVSEDSTFAADVTQLKGFVDGAGNYMFAGTHALSQTTFILSGKVVFRAGSLRPISITGKVQGVSVGSAHFGTGTFKSVGKPLAP